MISQNVQANLRAAYNPDGSSLRNLQLRMLEMLIFIDTVCQKHNIRYILSSGTLLGAVRHGGFIPWDDDVDIELELSEYRKLLRILPKEVKNTPYKIQTWKTDPFLKQNFAKLRDTNSEIDEKVTKGLIYTGCFIDIFPMTDRSSTLAKKSLSIANLILMRFDFQFLPTCIRRVYLFIASFFLFEILFTFLRKITPKSDYVGHNYGVGFFKKRRKDCYYPIKRIKFEEHTFNAPNHTDDYLEQIFGSDFLSIPPKDKRIVHCSNYRFYE